MLLQARNGVPRAGIPAHHPPSQHANLEEIQRKLKPGWTVHLAQDDRLFYCNHLTQTSSWIPPSECWSATGGGFPYGWEQAADNDGKPYFINHLNKTTTFEDPRKDWTEEPAVPRTVELQRDAELGFGFVAGSEKPVIVRFVTEGSPSVGKLQPGDQILTINGEDVKKAPRDHVIKLVRACKETVTLEVCQPPLDNSGRKSTLLSAAKKAKLKSNPSRVRFAEGVVVNGSPLFPPSNFSLGDSSVPFLPNVLKVFLENGQTKSFKYDSNTTVRDVVESLQQKLCIKAMEHFSLVVEHVKSLRRNKLTLLDPNEPLARIAARPGSHNLRCLFRAAFVPRAASDLATRDLVALEYLYMQCCNDVVQERYAPELKYDIALRLAALHIHQHAIANNLSGKVTVKTVEREFGLERFVPVSLMTTMKRKELRKLISHFLKLNHNLSPTGQKSLTSLQAKLYYLNIISELPSYGAKCFSTNVRDSNMERVILVSPKFGISQILGIRNSVPVPLADIEQMSLVTMTREDELSRRVCIHLPSTKEKQLSLSLEDRDAEELILVLQGYYRLLTGEPLRVDQDRDPSWNDDAAPNYHSPHQVIPTRWSYAMQDDNQHYANFSVAPPYQVLPPGNGHVSSATGTPTMQRAAPCLDKNMNNTKSIKDDKTNGTFDLQSVVSMELLESDRPYVEARNQEVLRRVQEMQELVHNSEQYILSERQRDRDQDQDRDREESDSESSHISSQDSDTPAPGELKHSDSLLLLTQGQKLLTEAVNEAVRNIDMGCDTEPSESDTDSMSTPTNSPSHKQNTGYSNGTNGTNGLKSSDSSFGLHSPDTLLPNGYRPSDVNIQDLLKRLQEDNCLPYNFAEGTLYLDPDIIDLTMIPPPITPDELNSDGPYPLPGHLSMPPTPFADGVSFDADQMNRRNVYGYNRWSQLSVQQDPNLDLNLDLEAFLATVAVQPPSMEAAPTVELTPEEILSYIIPPPPVTAQPICTQPPHPAPSFVIEYPTVERKGGPFSCCGQTAPAPVRPSKTPAPSLPPRQTIWTQPLKKPPLPPVPSQEVLKKSCLRNGTYDSNQSPVRNGAYDNVPTALRNGAYDNIQPPLRNGSYDNVQPAQRNGHIINRDDLGSLQDSREAIFNKSDKLIATYLDRLDFVVAQCLRAQAAGGGQNMDEASFQVAKGQLTNVARYLVTASKMLVKSANDGANLAQNVSNCLRQISQLTELASDVAVHTTAPVQTRNLVLKVRDVVSVFRATLGASLVAPNEMLLQRAENLAGALAALLRSLRVFSP